MIPKKKRKLTEGKREEGRGGEGRVGGGEKEVEEERKREEEGRKRSAELKTNLEFLAQVLAPFSPSGKAWD